MRGFLFLVLGALFFVPTVSCKHEEPSRPPVPADDPYEGSPVAGGGAGDGGSAADGGATDAGDAGVCSALETTSALVDENAVSGDVPPGKGGVIADGTYDLKAASLFVGTALPGPTGKGFKESIRIQGTAFERVRTLVNASRANSTERISGTLRVEGATLTLALACPAAGVSSLTYSATSTSLILSNVSSGESREYLLRQ